MTTTMPPPPPPPAQPSGSAPPPPPTSSSPADPTPTRRGPLGILFAVLAIGITLVSVAYGVASVVNVLAVRTYHTTTSFPLTDTLVLRGGDSRITLVADATDEIVVEASVRRGIVDPPVVASMRGDELVLDGSCAQVFTSFCLVTLTVHVPQHLSLRGGLDDGTLTANGLIGPVALSIGDGWADLTDFDADTVDLSVVDGHAEISLVDAPESIRLRSGDGTASICLPQDAPAYAAAVSKADGSVRVEVPVDPRSSRPMDLSTVDGGISARLCADRPGG